MFEAGSGPVTEGIAMFSPADKLIAPQVGDPTVDAAQLLFVRVICQAVEDYGTPARRAEIDAFFSGPAFARYCGLLGWNRDWAQRRIQRFITSGAPLPLGKPASGRLPNTGFDFP
jgi:hypothetical protein